MLVAGHGQRAGWPGPCEALCQFRERNSSACVAHPLPCSRLGDPGSFHLLVTGEFSDLYCSSF